MQMPTATDADKDFFHSLVPDAPNVELKPMFGSLGAFVNGNMFAGLSGSSVGVKLLDETAHAELSAVEGTGPFGPAERPMSGYLALPDAWRDQPGLATPWLEAALAQVGAMPPKVKKPRRS